MEAKVQWPNGKAFAFTVFDDSDFATLENVSPVYDFLANCGVRTTKSVWSLRGSREVPGQGETCADSKYLKWLLLLQRAGFEIGYHMATYHTSEREQTAAGLTRFGELFGSPPVTMANHFGCTETVYWGSYRLTGANRRMYDLLTRFRHRRISFGHIETDARFWGDLCKAQIKYVRNFVFPDINTLKTCPFMPYHDPARPYVNHWFASSEGAEVRSFTATISEDAQDRLEAEGGACIMYTHFGSGFFSDGRLDPQFQRRIERLSRKNGWFVPVSQLLDFLLNRNGAHTITDSERNCLERRWLISKLLRGTS